MLDQIKTLLNIEVKLEEMKLENGTIVSAESFEKDKEIFIVTDDEKVAMPVGEYLLEDGRLVVVEEEGKIADVREVSDEVPEKETEEGKEITSDLAEEVEEEIEQEEEAEELGYATKEELAEVKDMIDEIKAMLEPKEEMSSEDLGNLLTEELSKHELNEVPQEVQEELNEPSAEPIMANPEADSTNKPSFKFAQNRKPSTFDRVLNKIINN